MNGTANLNRNNQKSDDIYLNRYESANIVSLTKSSDKSLNGDENHGVPFSPFSAGATLINLILATGPFSYPDSYVKWSPLVGTLREH